MKILKKVENKNKTYKIKLVKYTDAEVIAVSYVVMEWW